MWFLLALIVAAVLGNFVLRRLVAKADREPVVAGGATADFGGISTMRPEEILKVWGCLAEDRGINLAGPLHPTIASYLERYETIGPDEFLQVLRRSLATRPFKENPAFTQIGVWGDGSEVLVRRDASDGRVYLADFEDGTPEQPEVFASSFEQYLGKAWECDEDSRR